MGLACGSNDSSISMRERSSGDGLGFRDAPMAAGMASVTTSTAQQRARVCPQECQAAAGSRAPARGSPFRREQADRPRAPARRPAARRRACTEREPGGLHDEVGREGPQVPVRRQPFEEPRDAVAAEGQRGPVADDERGQRRGQADEQEQPVRRPALGAIGGLSELPRDRQRQQQEPGDEHPAGKGGAAPPHLKGAHRADERGQRQADFDGEASCPPAGAPHRPEADEPDREGGRIGQHAVLLVEEERRDATDQRPQAHLRSRGSAVRCRRPG